jgi:hypothetical protein
VTHNDFGSNTAFVGILGMDNDALDTMDQFFAVIAIFRRLRRLAPAAIENGVGGGDACRVGRILRPHDADQGVDRASGVAARERANLGQRSLGHEQANQVSYSNGTISQGAVSGRVAATSSG